MQEHMGFDSYRQLLGSAVVDSLFELASPLKGMKVVHVNSTKEGGGVAEILSKMVPLMQALGLDASWETIEGNGEFFRCTKMFHNLLQGDTSDHLDDSLLRAYEQVNGTNAKKLTMLDSADFVFIHDPQPLALITHFPERKGSWIWRCHIDLSAPCLSTWEYLNQFAHLYDASIFSMKKFARVQAHPIYIVPPSIDPFSEKNCELAEEDVVNVYKQLKIDLDRPVLLQVSRFDRFKDPIGVIQAYREVKQTHPDVQLVLAGSGATDDPEGDAVLKEVKAAAQDDKDIHILLLPATSHLTINALQRGADIILQKSIKEGFGLTVSEGLWKSKPVIGGNVGGICLQIIDGQTGFLVSSPEEAAIRILELLKSPQMGKKLGAEGRKLVMEKFLITRHLKDYLTILLECRNENTSKTQR